MKEHRVRNLGPKTVMFVGAVNDLRIDYLNRRIRILNDRYTRIKDKKSSFVTFPEEEVGSNRRLDRLDTKIVNLFRRRGKVIEAQRRLYQVK